MRADVVQMAVDPPVLPLGVPGQQQQQMCPGVGRRALDVSERELRGLGEVAFLERGHPGLDIGQAPHLAQQLVPPRNLVELNDSFPARGQRLPQATLRLRPPAGRPVARA